MTLGANMSVKNVTKYYKNNFKAVDNVSLEINKGEFLTILGPSGSGKTSLLKLIAGFETLSQGSIKLNSEDISKKEPYLRNIGMLFQNYALFPHMTVFDNIAYPLKIRKLLKQQIKEEVDNILELVQLTAFKDRYPTQLSGGQQQRVALARAIVFKPPLLLLDEPLGALDKSLRQSMQLEIKRIQKAVGITTISVTHDQEEALTMSDRVCVMKDGKVMQVDTPEGLYKKPANRFVAEFIGEINLIEGYVNEVKDDYAIVALNEKIQPMAKVSKDVRSFHKKNVLLAIRPEDIRISTEKGMYDTEFNVTVKESTFIGEGLKVTVDSPIAKDLFIKIPSYQAYKVRIGELLRVGWNYNNGTLLLSEEDESIEEHKQVG